MSPAVAACALTWIALAVAVVGVPGSVAVAASPDSCVTCHLETGDERLAKPALDFQSNDVHANKGFGCTSCHGGDPTEPGMEAMDPAKGYIGKPEGWRIVQVCGRCHSDAEFMKHYNPALRVDQVAEYMISVHGQRLTEHADAKVATCASCHRAHSIRPPSDPRSSVHPLRVAETCGRCHSDAEYMEDYNIPTDQVEEYQGSFHWKAMSVKGDLSAPTCNDCHGNHGAAPPGISWVGNVCGQCHAVMFDYFTQSVHSQVFAMLGTPGCATCHGNHQIGEPDDTMLGLGEEAVCSGCHASDDEGGKVAVAMRNVVDQLRTRHDRAHEILTRAERVGMEVSRAQFDLSGAKDALVKARAAVHSFTAEAVTQEAEAGLAVADKAWSRGVEALEEYQFRRKWLAVSLVIVVAAIAGLVLKIRQVDRGPGAGSRAFRGGAR